MAEGATNLMNDAQVERNMIANSKDMKTYDKKLRLKNIKSSET